MSRDLKFRDCPEIVQARRRDRMMIRREGNA